MASKIGLAFKREGLTLTGGSTLNFVVEQLKQHRHDEDFLGKVIRAIDRQRLKQNLVDVEAFARYFIFILFFGAIFFFFSQFICRAVETVTVDVGAKVEQEALKVISALECPRHEFKESRKTFVLDSTPKSLHGSADQAAMFRHRFELVRQRVMRHPMFTTHKLTTVKSLLGATGLISVCTRWSQLLFGFHSFFRSKDCFWFADAKQHGAIDFGGSEQYGSIGHDKLQAGRRTVHGPLLGAGRRRIAPEQLVFRVCHVDATN